MFRVKLYAMGRYFNFSKSIVIVFEHFWFCFMSNAGPKTFINMVARKFKSSGNDLGTQIQVQAQDKDTLTKILLALVCIHS